MINERVCPHVHGVQLIIQNMVVLAKFSSLTKRILVRLHRTKLFNEANSCFLADMAFDVPHTKKVLSAVL